MAEPYAAGRCLIAVLACALSLTSGSAQQTPQSDRPATAAVSGVVTEAGSNTPVSGAIVTLGGRQTSAVATDSKGRFVFRFLPAGTYRLTVAKPGFVATGLAQSVLGPGAPFLLADDQWIDDASIVLWRLGAITGSVRDDRGQPAVGVVVRVLRKVSLAGRTYWADGPTAATDDRGVYRIPGLMHGDYVVVIPPVQPGTPVSADPAAAYQPQFFPNARTIGDAAVLSLKDGQDISAIDLVARSVRAVTVAGRVIGPPEGVGRVPLRLLAIDPLEPGLEFEFATTVTASDGTFILSRVPTGTYTIEMKHFISRIQLRSWLGSARAQPPSGYSPDTMSAAVPADFFTGPLSFEFRESLAPAGFYGSVNVVVGEDGDVRNVTLPVERLPAVTGRVISENSEPLGGVAFVVAEPATGDPSLGVVRAKVAADGGFALPGVRPGRYFIRPVVAFVRSVTRSGVDYTRAPITIRMGEDVTDVVITKTSRVGSVSGEVVDRTGARVSAGAVVLFPADPTTWRDFGLDPSYIRSARFYSGQPFQINFVPAGEFLIAAVPEEHSVAWQQEGFLARIAPSASRVTLGWGERSRVNLTLIDAVGR